MMNKRLDFSIYLVNIAISMQSQQSKETVAKEARKDAVTRNCTLIETDECNK
jgi:hypothetical protein